MLDERVVLLSGTLGQGLEPVRIVGDAILNGPLLHAGSYSVGYGSVETGTIVDDVDEVVIFLHSTEQKTIPSTGMNFCPMRHLLQQEHRKHSVDACQLKLL